MSSFNFQKKVLPNGLRVIMVPMKETEATTLLVLFGVGSRFENQENSGVSHFIEHMMFKGTKKRPTTLDISRTLDRVGAEYNAFTAKDLTGYWVTSTEKHFPLIADVLFDMLLSSKFEEKELARERQVILEEIKMYQENPLMHIDDLFDNLLFAGHQLGVNIAGSKESMLKIGRKELVSFKEKFYQPKNTVVVVAGKLKSETMKQVSDLTKKFRNKNNFLEKIDKFQFRKTKPVSVFYQEVDQTQLALGFLAYSRRDKKLPALRLLSVILGGNMSSRLFISVRERRGLAYFINSDVDVFSDTGSLKVRAGLDVARIDEAIKIILGELNLIRQGVTEKELKDAKEFFRGRTILSLEDSAAQADWCGKQELLLGQIKTPKQKMAELDRVTTKQIKAAAQEIIKKDTLRCALIGPWKKDSKFARLLNF